MARLGDRYGRLGIAVMLLERVFQQLKINYDPGDRFSCGEFVGAAFQDTGCPLFPGRRTSEIEPGDFAALLEV